MEWMNSQNLDTHLWQSLPKSSEIRVEKAEWSDFQKKVNEVASTLWEKWKKYTFIVYRSSSQKVLHAIGWLIYLPEWLIKIAKNDTEIAFLLNHEIAHWENGDIKNDKVRIPLSKWNKIDAECRADEAAKKSTIEALGLKSREKLQAFLRRLQEKYARENCADD